MKKIFLVIALVTAGVHFTKAQDVREHTIRLKKTDVPAFTANYNYPKSVVKKVLADRLAAMGLHHKKSQKGFNVYKESVWQQITDTKEDIYTKISGSAQRSVVYILISKGYDNYISSATDPGTSEKVKAFLTALEKDMRTYQHQLVVAAQQKELEQQQKKEHKLREELERQISETQKAQAALDATKTNTTK